MSTAAGLQKGCRVRLGWEAGRHSKMKLLKGERKEGRRWHAMTCSTVWRVPSNELQRCCGRGTPRDAESEFEKGFGLLHSHEETSVLKHSIIVEMSAKSETKSCQAFGRNINSLVPQESSPDQCVSFMSSSVLSSLQALTGKVHHFSCWGP